MAGGQTCWAAAGEAVLNFAEEGSMQPSRLIHWIGQPPVLDRHEVVTIDGDVDTLRQATP